ncbi:hypothetical protein E2C01_046852 [Portunus trituberculatus]|uniref:Uncharacterized protein n=1 Tax=Portunus trituberculatus TaxID=210409 RepID=A0A5B7FYV7_PORTR|nr:hypothetical protein [Portunus trituberculatus]
MVFCSDNHLHYLSPPVRGMLITHGPEAQCWRFLPSPSSTSQGQRKTRPRATKTVNTSKSPTEVPVPKHVQGYVFRRVSQNDVCETALRWATGGFTLEAAWPSLPSPTSRLTVLTASWNMCTSTTINVPRF